MNKIILLIKAILHLRLRAIYHLLIRSSNLFTPKITVKKVEHGCFSGFENDYLFQQAIKVGINEPHFESLIKNILSVDDTALDLGGNIGTHSIVMSRILSSGKVYTFEPQSLVFSILQNNILLNSCDNVIAYRFAISNESHNTISMQPFSFAGSYINNGALRVDLTDALGDLALTRTLDSFDFGRVDFIKIDVQGSELKALQGARKLLSKFKPYIFIEIEEQHLRALKASTEELIEYIFELGYALYRIEAAYPCDHICVPIGKVSEFEAKIIPKLKINLSPKIYGKKVDVIFKNKCDQNYQELIVH